MQIVNWKYQSLNYTNSAAHDSSENQCDKNNLKTIVRQIRLNSENSRKKHTIIPGHIITGTDIGVNFYNIS